MSKTTVTAVALAASVALLPAVERPVSARSDVSSPGAVSAPAPQFSEAAAERMPMAEFKRLFHEGALPNGCLMKRKPLDLEAIADLHNQGLKVVDIADRLGVHKGNVSKALKKLGRDVTRCVVPAAVEQYEKKTALMESLFFFVSDYMRLYRAGSKGKPPESAAEYAAWLDCQLKVGAESRKVITAIADISYKMFQAEEMAEILRIIDEEIGLESPECQKRIRDRIERRRAVRFPSIPN